MTSTIGGKARLHAAGLQPGLHAVQAAGLEALLFVVFAGERLHDADRGQDLGDARQQRAFLLADDARRRFDSTRDGVDDQEEDGCDRERNQRKPPVDPQHHSHHADQGEEIDENPEQRRADEVLHGIDVVDDP